MNKLTDEIVKSFADYYESDELVKEIEEVFNTAICSDEAKNWTEVKKQNALFLKNQIIELVECILKT